MQLYETLESGFFDTAVSFAGKRSTEERRVGTYELEFMVSATGKALINGRTYELSPGTLLCALPGDLRASVLDFQCFFLHLRLPEDSPYRELLDSLPTCYRILNGEKYGRIFEELTQHQLTFGHAQESEFISAKLMELFYYLRKDAQRNRNYLAHAGGGRSADDSIPRAVRFIREHFQRPLSLEDIAAVTGYSPNHFHRLFSSVMGKSPCRYLLEVRVREAKYLLARPEIPLSEVAYACGFSSQAYFTEQFKRMSYFTPGHYRKLCQESYLRGSVPPEEGKNF